MFVKVKSTTDVAKNNDKVHTVISLVDVYLNNRWRNKYLKKLVFEFFKIKF